MRIPFSRPRSASIASAGPLSVGVPLEGTDTVPGLRALERRAAADGIARLLGVAAANGFAPGRKYTRYRGPYLDQLTLESLKAEPKKWSEFFGVGRGQSGSGAARSSTTKKKKKEKTGDGDGGVTSDDKPSSSSSTSSSPPSWTLPMSMLALRERAEENLVAFLPNYLRFSAALVVLLAALGGRPLSLVGLACLAGFAVANARGLFGGPSVAEAIAKKQQQLVLEQQQRAAAAAAAGGQAPPAAAARPAAGAEEAQTPPARAAATVFAYGVAAYTRAFNPLTRGVALGVFLAAFHACLRVAETERAAWAAAAALAEQRQQKKVSLYAVAGVPFRDVVFGAPRASSSSAAAQQQQKHQRGGGEDPRRCLRELAAAARALASAAAIGARAGAAAAVDAAVARAKALRQQLLLR